jgi:hypothetical protein
MDFFFSGIYVTVLKLQTRKIEDFKIFLETMMENLDKYGKDLKTL